MKPRASIPTKQKEGMHFFRIQECGQILILCVIAGDSSSTPSFHQETVNYYQIRSYYQSFQSTKHMRYDQ